MLWNFALQKKRGPIAIGGTHQGLAAKVVGGMVMEGMVMEDVAEQLAPKQVGYEIWGGAEAATHVTRKYLKNMASN